MESLIVIILGLAFYWLMVETKWLTVRLLVGQQVIPESDALNAIIAITPLLIMIGFLVGAISAGFVGAKKIGYSIMEHEEEMKKLWKIYKRKQPSKVGS